MLRIELTADEAQTLREALDLYLAEFKREIAGTENPEFRHSLEHRRRTLEGIITRLAWSRAA